MCRGAERALSAHVTVRCSRADGAGVSLPCAARGDPEVDLARAKNVETPTNNGAQRLLDSSHIFHSDLPRIR